MPITEPPPPYVLPTLDIRRSITKIVEKIGNANLKKFERLNYDQVAIKNKIDLQIGFFIYEEVIAPVMRYFRFIKE